MEICILILCNYPKKNYRYTNGMRSKSRNMLIWFTANIQRAGRAFSVAAPSTCNSLPAEIRLYENILTFKRHLKTHLFKLT